MPDPEAVRVCQCAAKAQVSQRSKTGVERGPYREEGRHEIDVVGEFGIGIVGVEIKATAAPTIADAAHLSYVRDRLGDRFLGGAVLHTGSDRPIGHARRDRKSTRLNSSHQIISYAVFCLKKKNNQCTIH